MASTNLCFSNGIIPMSSSVRCNRVKLHPQCARKNSPPSSISIQSPSAENFMQQRRSANYPPNVWEHSYIQSLATELVDEEDALNHIRNLKEDIRNLLCKQGADHQLQLIDDVQQLGLSYHFQKEIKDALTSIYEMINTSTPAEYDIYTTSLAFRLLREHGFQISMDIFNYFKDEKGRFTSNLRHDTKGMLSLYEASHHKMQGEKLMDEARKFAVNSLRDAAGSPVSSLLKERVAYALELPLQYRMERLHHLWFIKMYEREENMNPALLKLAKLDFNLVQSIHRRELKKISWWWKNLELGDIMGFARDRLVENFLWSVGFAYEPAFWRSREVVTKAACLITFIDDVYDVYGSLEELKLFTEVVSRWDATRINQLPNYMKICFMALFNTTNDSAYNILKLKGVDTLPCLRKAWADLCNTYLEEARWYHGGYMPTFKEYMENAWISISAHILVTLASCTSDDLTQESLELFNSYPDAVRYSSILLRLYNDLATSTAELERGDVPKSIQCYMHENKVSEAASREHIKDLIHSTWVDLNEECIANSRLVESYKKVVLNIPKMAQCIYQHGDGYMESSKETKDNIISLLIVPIRL